MMDSKDFLLPSTIQSWEDINLLAQYIKHPAVKEPILHQALNWLREKATMELTDQQKEDFCNAWHKICSWYGNYQNAQQIKELLVEGLNFCRQFNLNKYIGRILYLLGNHYYFLGKLYASFRCHLRGLQICHYYQDELYAGLCSAGIAGNYHAQGNAEFALKYFLKAKKILEKSNYVHVELMYANIASCYFDLNEHQKGHSWTLRAIRKALDIQSYIYLSY
ncbi:MAG: hypothetical protein NZ108_08720, partial [Bacteroidia bacterium]|nr:hypothetical protein [Bacteroidia bacterium]